MKEKIISILNNQNISELEKNNEIRSVVEENLFEENTVSNGDSLVLGNSTQNVHIHFNHSPILIQLNGKSGNTPTEENIDKPLEKIKTSFLAFCMKGKRKYISLPIIIIFLTIISFSTYKDKFSGGIEAIEDTFNHKEILSKEEYDIMNEWVVEIWCFDDYTKAKEGYTDFVNAYKNSNHNTWINDIFLVRNYKVKKSWCIVLDMDYGKSTKEIMQNRIDNMKQYSGSTRALQNTLGNWFQNYNVILYDKSVFENTYGTIFNYKTKDFEK